MLFYIILITVSILLFVWGEYEVKMAKTISEYPPFEHYEWRIFSYPIENPIEFHEFMISYQFSKNKGNLYFTPEGSLNNLTIHFPKNLSQIPSVRINNNSRWENLPTDITPNGRMYTFNFKENISEKWIWIEFYSSLSPNSEINIYKNSYWGDGKIYYDLGEVFECVRDDCVFNMKNIYITDRDTSSINTVRLQLNQSGDPRESKLYSLEMLAQSKKLIDNKSYSISLGASLIAGAIFGLFSVIIAIIQHKYKK